MGFTRDGLGKNMGSSRESHEKLIGNTREVHGTVTLNRMARTWSVIRAQFGCNPCATRARLFS